MSALTSLDLSHFAHAIFVFLGAIFVSAAVTWWLTVARRRRRIERQTAEARRELRLQRTEIARQKIRDLDYVPFDGLPSSGWFGPPRDDWSRKVPPLTEGAVPCLCGATYAFADEHTVIESLRCPQCPPAPAPLALISDDPMPA